MDSHFDSFKANLQQKVHKYQHWYTFQGILFIVFGVLAIILPSITALSLELILGVLLLTSGLLAAFSNIRSHVHWSGLFAAIIAIIVGAVMLVKPIVGLVALSLLVAIFLSLKGISEIIMAFKFKPLNSWGWLLFSGIITLVLATVAWLNFPFMSIVYLGIIIGLNMILYGLSLLALIESAKE